MTFVSGGETIIGDSRSSIAIENGVASGTLVVPGYAPQLLENGSYGSLQLASATIQRAYCRMASLGLDATEFALRIDDITAGDIQAPAQATRELFLGMVLGTTVLALSPRIVTQIFGRPAIIESYSSLDGLGLVDSVQVVYTGSRLTTEESFALIDLLRFLTGSRGNSWLTETFDAEGKRLGFSYRNRGATSQQHALHPLDFRPGPQNDTVSVSFPAMLNRMLEMNEANRSGMAATLHHYNDAAIQRFPVSRLRDLIVALEALCAAQVHDVESSPTSRRGLPRIFAFLAEIGIDLTAVEKTTLKRYRDAILHTGHYGDDTDIIVHRQNIRVAGLFANTYNRAFLRLLGFPGEYLDAISLSEVYELADAPSFKDLSLAERIKKYIRTIGPPDTLRGIDVDFGEDDDESPNVSITLHVSDDPSEKVIEALNEFAEKLRSELLRQEDIPWPYIRFSAL